MIRKGYENLPTVYLTFDDGPDPRFTPRILDLLDLFQISASFFVLGRACTRFPALVKRIQDNGHTVGSHGYDHWHPWLIGSQRARQDVRKGYDTIASICGEAPRFFRPPYGRTRKAMLAEAESLGMETVLWNRSAIDWGPMAGIDSIGRRLSRTRGGDIVLCHDAPRVKNCPDMMLAVLPGFIEGCQRRQLRFAGLDELLTSAVDCQATANPRPSLSAVQSV